MGTGGMRNEQRRFPHPDACIICSPRHTSSNYIYTPPKMYGHAVDRHSNSLTLRQTLNQSAVERAKHRAVIDGHHSACSAAFASYDSSSWRGLVEADNKAAAIVARFCQRLVSPPTAAKFEGKGEGAQSLMMLYGSGG